MPDTQSTEAAMLDRVIRTEKGEWSKEAAESILRFAFPAEDVDRMNLLAAKARAGELQPDEQIEIENYMRVGRFLELIKSKARISLKHRASAA